MSLTIGELKKVSVQSIRDIAVGLRAKAASLRATKAGVTDLPHKGTWTGVAADNADHEIGTFATGVGNDADAYENAAKKVDTAGDEFEGLKQLLTKLENEAAGKFSINDATGEVTPLTKDFNKSDRDYIANTIKQLCAAGGQANDDLAAAIHATDASGATSPAGAAGGLPDMPGSSIKPDGARGALQNLAAPNPDGDPGATKAAGAGTDTQANYKEWYPKNAVPVGDKNVDPSKLGGVGSLPGVRDAASGREPPAKLAPALQAKDVPAFKAAQREILTRMGVPADQIEGRVNAAAESAQNPHLVRTDVPSASPSEHVSRDFGEQWNKFFANASDGGSKAGDALLQQGKELTGQAGPGAPGVAEAWKNLATDTAKGLWDYTTATPQERLEMLGNEAHRIADNPGGYLGEKLVQGAAGAAAAPIGGEAAAGLRGLLGDLTGAEGRALTHGLDDATPGHHTPSLEHSISTGGDHTPASVGDHHAPSTDSWSGHSGFDSSGQISSELRDQIVSIEKGERPDPATYLPHEYIQQHLEQFDKGVARFMTDENLDSFGIGQRDGTSFVMPKGEADALMNATRGDPRAMEDALGLPEGFLDKNRIVRVDIEDPRSYDLRMPSGNEAGANSQWIPGGRLPGGESEAIIDGGRVPRADYKISDIPGR
ncbi:hypothetical protein [Mycobacteroides abscessus]|uniref:hypothetical protein n=1 Tax=Mycobacteroides abscessus TaxID=36809 RepID=UPI001F387EC9|nr:hypothetical protein [Mycobacteroides abscessus]